MKGNCTKLQRYNGTGWDTISKRVSMTGPGLSRETVEEEQVLDCDPSGGNSTKLKSPGTKEIGDISIEILWNPTVPTGTHQVETATLAGTVTVAGNAVITITSDVLTGGTKTFNIPVTTGGVSIWGPQILAYLQTHASAAELRTFFALTGAANGTTLVLTRNEPDADDGTLNILSGTGTATGITNNASSTATTAGVAGEENDENHHLFEDDFEAETATFWRIIHPNDAATGVLVHATVKEIEGETYEANQTVKRSITLEPTGQYYKRGNAIEEEALPGTIEAPMDHYGHH